jgi:hypothetical protein
MKTLDWGSKGGNIEPPPKNSGFEVTSFKEAGGNPGTAA